MTYPLGGKLNQQNRWMQLAQLIPGWKVEEYYGEGFKS
jgi:IS5 family transposase